MPNCEQQKSLAVRFITRLHIDWSNRDLWKLSSHSANCVRNLEAQLPNPPDRRDEVTSFTTWPHIYAAKSRCVAYSDSIPKCKYIHSFNEVIAPEFRSPCPLTITISLMDGVYFLEI